MKKNIRISSAIQDLEEGLFGQIFLWVFEILPYLDERRCLPMWAIRSRLYGTPDQDYIVIPGLLELNYDPENSDLSSEDLSLMEIRAQGVSVLGNDWDYISSLWKKYFRIPARVIRRADTFPALDAALGLHYRGTDKNRALDETNFVSEDDFLALAGDFIGSHPDIRIIFIASDENAFVENFRAKYCNHQIVSSGEVIHHKELTDQADFGKGDHAMLDCLLLSRCKYLLKCQSALSGFTKILNPEIEAYRISANKLPSWNREIPYFPDGYLPKYTSSRPECQKILDRLFIDDWTTERAVFRRFKPIFKYRRRKSRFGGIRTLAVRFLRMGRRS